MNSLVLQLQAAAMDSETLIADLLRKAKIVSVKLDLTDVREWIDHEMNGYPDLNNLPEYRILFGKLKAWNPYRGWIPAIINDQRIEDIVSKFQANDAISVIEDTVRRTEDGAGYVAYSPNQQQQIVLSDMFNFQTQFQVHIPISAAIRLLDAVRNRILDWSLSLEKAGVLGIGMHFTLKEREAVREMSGNTYNITGNVGILGDVSKSQVQTNQGTSYTPSDFTELREITRQIRICTNQLPEQIQTSTLSALAEIDAELGSRTPRSSRIQQGLASIRTSCEGAVGNLIASGILALIGKFLS
ncbi:hypothetical protein FBZ87_105267 [Nitrospirillum amazonense]|uniref:AbiTii domain-containing protein n=1 Tax=Nitrospirillum amazonense TaxID=28077 RepID=A0A560JQS0_9PROT|nr:hypothetical protein [Nitrospirillum amazonense]TWB73346.1 hypothetical protein FBZ87_105267 [Nitrospirillum amazonense]